MFIQRSAVKCVTADESSSLHSDWDLLEAGDKRIVKVNLLKGVTGV